MTNGNRRTTRCAGLASAISSISSISSIMAIIAIIASAGGCASKLKQEQLERVARDWCQVVRASQVIPVYPLTEDLQPGDIFLVQMPVAHQAKLYAEKGFLPLDQQVTRLAGIEYGKFYGDGYWAGAYDKAPHPRPLPATAHPAPEGATPPAAPAVRAPRAAFPSYSFSVETGSALSLAIPVSGVPVGLGLMGAESANGSLTISNAYTYGVPIEQMLVRVRAWAGQPAVRHELRTVARAVEDKLYLRVVNRVYLAGGVTVALANADEMQAAADVGAGGGASLLERGPLDAEAAEMYRAGLESLSSAVSDSLPGGSIQFAQASQRSVTLEETFDRPLAIGYLGFDCLVQENGELGPPVPSFDVLMNEAQPQRAALTFEEDDNSRRLDAWLDQPGNLDKLNAWLKANGVEVDSADIISSAEHRWLRAYIVRDLEIPDVPE